MKRNRNFLNTIEKSMTNLYEQSFRTYANQWKAMKSMETFMENRWENHWNSMNSMKTLKTNEIIDDS